MRRVIFYFDGFNFYNGLKDKSSKDPQWKNYYWIDLVKLARQFFDDKNEITAVKYFTAPPLNSEKRSRQSAFLKAIELLNPGRFFVCNGQYQHKTITCLGSCKEEFRSPEEKRTDVSIAVQMLLDCMNDVVDTLVLVSADSDQMPTIQAIREQFPRKTLKVYFPPERNSSEIQACCKPVVFLENHEEKFKNAKMPGEVSNDQKKYTRPASWKY